LRDDEILIFDSLDPTPLLPGLARATLPRPSTETGKVRGLFRSDDLGQQDGILQNDPRAVESWFSLEYESWTSLFPQRHDPTRAGSSLMQYKSIQTDA
jgi:hypothetical protein